MKRLLFVLQMMICSMSWADWEMTGKEYDLTHYHDKSTIQINDITAQMWVMYDFPEVRTNTDGDRYKSGACKLFCVNADGTLIGDRAADHQIQ